MIFLSVGTQLGFDRLVRCVDLWAARTPSADVFAQIGGGRYVPSHCRWARELPRGEYEDRIAACELIVSHAGMGTVLAAGDSRKPIIVMPRRGELGEHRNDHQWDIRRVLGVRGVLVAEQARHQRDKQVP